MSKSKMEYKHSIPEPEFLRQLLRQHTTQKLSARSKMLSFLVSF